MLIISKKSNKDYYDGVVGTTGIDKSIVYDRKIIEIENRNEIPQPFEIDRSKGQWNNPFYKLNRLKINPKQKKYFDIVPFYIGFCGKLYVGWKLYYEKNNSFSNEIKTDFEYNIDKIINSYIELNNNKDITQFRERVKYFQNIDLMHLFRKYSTPCFIYDPDYNRRIINQGYFTRRFFINPILKDYQFYNKFDAFQTLQEIQMFIGGVLGTNEKETVTIADKYKIKKHGFDKWSFRRMSKKKK